jgi:tagaturonate reductase
MLPLLSRALLDSPNLTVPHAPEPVGPINVLQIGEGNFLRGFVDWMIDVANQRGVFSGRVAVAQPIPEGLAGKLDQQDGLFSVLLRGIENGESVDDLRIVTCVRSIINPYADWTRMLELAASADLRFVVSNTTEAGIADFEEAYDPDRVPRSFPAKVAALLHARYRTLNGSPQSGLVFLPCELIEGNGDSLKRIVLLHAQRWNLEPGFTRWVETSNYFLNTLVDRIVPGYPTAEAEALQARFGYVDPLLVAAEPFHMWVIEGPAKIAKEFPLHKAGLNVVWTGDLRPYRTRKVRILNGAHTASALAAYCAGLDTVTEMIEDPVVSRYLNRVMFEEIVPFVPLPDAERGGYAASIMERFGNTFIRHELISIALNSVSKWKVRVLPTVRDYARFHGRAPAGLAFSLAALLRFYRGTVDAGGAHVGLRNGQAYPIKDDATVLAILDAAWRTFDIANPQVMVRTVLADPRLWGEDLCQLADLPEQVAARLARIEAVGMKVALAELIAP